MPNGPGFGAEWLSSDWVVPAPQAFYSGFVHATADPPQVRRFRGALAARYGSHWAPFTGCVLEIHPDSLTFTYNRWLGRRKVQLRRPEGILRVVESKNPLQSGLAIKVQTREETLYFWPLREKRVISALTEYGWLPVDWTPIPGRIWRM